MDSFQKMLAPGPRLPASLPAPNSLSGSSTSLSMLLTGPLWRRAGFRKKNYGSRGGDLANSENFYVIRTAVENQELAARENVLTKYLP